MTDYTKLVEALRWCDADFIHECDNCLYLAYKHDKDDCMDRMLRDAADAIKGLQAEVERLKDSNDELREAQTYIDHYGDKWMTSAKDVPTAAYEHGYADGRDEAMAKMEGQDKGISKFADGEWWKEAQDDKV